MVQGQNVTQGALLHRSHAILMPFYPILCYFSPEILVFQQPLITESQNQCHWIWHASNPIYTPLKPFQCIFPSQNQQNVNFLAVCLTPLSKNKKTSILTGQSVQKGLKICIFSQMSPQQRHLVSRAVLHKVSLTFGQPLGQADLQSDVCPSRGIQWPRPVLCKVSLTFGQPLGQVDLQSDVPPSRGIQWLRRSSTM